MRLRLAEWESAVGMTEKSDEVRLPEYYDEEVDIRAAGALCPMSGCGALAIAYRRSDSLHDLMPRPPAKWEFVCPECSSEFAVSQEDLLFQSVPRDWLLADVCHA